METAREWYQASIKINRFLGNRQDWRSIWAIIKTNNITILSLEDKSNLNSVSSPLWKSAKAKQKALKELESGPELKFWSIAFIMNLIDLKKIYLGLTFYVNGISIGLLFPSFEFDWTKNNVLNIFYECRVSIGLFSL